MAFSYLIDKERQLVISTASDVVTFAEIIAHQDSLSNDPDFSPQFSQFLDATRITALDISTDQARTVARRPVFSSTSRRALVTSRPAIFGMGRMLGAYHELSSVASQIEIFSDVPSALKWLGLESDPR